MRVHAVVAPGGQLGSAGSGLVLRPALAVGGTKVRCEAYLRKGVQTEAINCWECAQAEGLCGCETLPRCV